MNDALTAGRDVVEADTAHAEASPEETTPPDLVDVEYGQGKHPLVRPLLTERELDRFRTSHAAVESVIVLLGRPRPRVYRHEIDTDIDATLNHLHQMERVLTRAKYRLAER